MTIPNDHYDGQRVVVDTDRDVEMAWATQARYHRNDESTASSGGMVGGGGGGRGGGGGGAPTAARPRPRPPVASRCESDGAVAPPSAHHPPHPPHPTTTTTTTTTPRGDGHRRTRSGSVPSSSPHPSPARVAYPSSPPSATGRPSSSPPRTHHHHQSDDDDEAFARRLDRELRDAELASRLAAAGGAGRSPLAAAERQRRHLPRHQHHPATAASDHPFGMADGGTVRGGRTVPGPPRRHDGFDVVLADAAAPPSPPTPPTTTNTTTATARGRGGRSAIISPPSGPPGDCRGKTVFYGARASLALTVVGITFVVWMSLFGRSVSDDLDPAAWLPGFPEGDPNLGSVGEHNRWDAGATGNGAGGGGLTLPIVDNLVYGSDWAGYLEESASDWDSGSPDAVTLRVVRSSEYDPDCRAVRMAVKVCNGDYGPTDWRGVNQVLLQNEYIITSLAKMNDYYLEGTTAAQKMYTMCHELGHGLGLGHSDENFNNADMGNCMDYTNLPQNNLRPDEYNFLILEGLYGDVNGGGDGGGDGYGYGDGGGTSEEMMLSSSGGSSGGGRRRAVSSSAEEFETYAAHLLDPITVYSSGADVVAAASGGGVVGAVNWRLLGRTDTAEHHERILGNGYTLRTSILLA